MLKGVVGFLGMFFVMLPFFLINIKIIKIKNNGKFVRVFLALLVLMIAAAVVVGLSLYPIGGNTLIGGLFAFAVYVVLIVIQLFLHARYVKEEEEHLDIGNDSFKNKMDMDSELEETEADPTLAVEPEEYENFKEIQTIRREKLQNSEEWKKTMDDLFK